MKKNLNLVLLIFIVTSFFVFNGCDELSTLEVNIPIGKEFHVQGPDNSLIESETFCLSEFEDWRDNVENIEDVKWLKASYRTLSDTLGNVTSPNLMGNLSYSLKYGGTPLFEENLGMVRVSDYMGKNAYEFELTDTEIEEINSVLELFKGTNICLTGTVTIDNITGGKDNNGDYNLFCEVELVLETTIKTD